MYMSKMGGSLHLCTGPEPACGISERVAAWVIRGLDVQQASRILAVYFRTKACKELSF
jgi:hypothetical protein